MDSWYARLIAILVSSLAIIVLRRALGMAVGPKGVDFILRLGDSNPLFSSIVFLGVPSAVVGLLASRWLGRHPVLYGSLLAISVYLILLAIGPRIQIGRCTFGGATTEWLPVTTRMVISAYLRTLPQQLLPLIIGSSLGLWLGALIARRLHG